MMYQEDKNAVIIYQEAGNINFFAVPVYQQSGLQDSHIRCTEEEFRNLFENTDRNNWFHIAEDNRLLRENDFYV